MNKKNKKRQGPRKGRLAQGRARLAPPEFVSTLALGHRFRFTGASGASAKSITRGMLLNLVSMATTTTNQFRILQAVRVKRVQVWSQPVTLGTAATAVVVEWVGNQAPSTIHSDTSVGVMPGYVSSRPPRDSSNRWWSISGSNESETLFKITCPTGSIIDVSLTCRLIDDESATAAENGTGAASTVGTIYWNYLDGFASKAFAPVGGVTVLP